MFYLFDFDGTLADSFDCVIDKANMLAKRFNLRQVSMEERESLRDLPSHEVLQFMQVPKYKIPILIYHMHNELRDAMSLIKPVPGMLEVLQELYARKHKMGIITSNSQENVLTWLKKNDMQHLFEFVHVESRLFSKRRVIKNTLARYKILKRDAMYIGDETRDIEAARNNDLISIAVTWGYNTAQVLQDYSPTYVVHEPNDLLSISPKS